MAFADLSSELSGNLPGLSPLLADTYIIRAYKKIRRARLWGFLMQDDVIVCPLALQTGTFSVVNDSNQVTADPVASAAIAALPILASPVTMLQIRFTGTGSSFTLYNIVTLDTTVPTAYILTLDRVVTEPTSVLTPYQIYKAYIVEPLPGFVRWVSIVDTQNARGFGLDYTSKDFDRLDPQRQSQGLAFRCGFYRMSTDQPGLPMYELWPHPTSGQTLYVRFQWEGNDFVNPTDVQGAVIPDDLIVQAALAFYAYPFAMANPNLFPSKRGTNWFQLISDGKKTYDRLLLSSKVEDDNQNGTSILNRGRRGRQGNRVSYPIDADFVQSHLVRF